MAEKRQCTDGDHIAWISTIDKFVESLLASEKAEPAFLAYARWESFAKDQPGHLAPYILNVTMDAHGGTSITRSNVWYSLGFPNAAVITSGLKASFALSDPESGNILASGVVRCATRPENYRKVRKLLIEAPSDAKNPRMICGYRLGTMKAL